MRTESLANRALNAVVSRLAAAGEDAQSQGGLPEFSSVPESLIQELLAALVEREGAERESAADFTLERESLLNDAALVALCGHAHTSAIELYRPPRDDFEPPLLHRISAEALALAVDRTRGLEVFSASGDYVTSAVLDALARRAGATLREVTLGLREADWDGAMARLLASLEATVSLTLFLPGLSLEMAEALPKSTLVLALPSCSLADEELAACLRRAPGLQSLAIADAAISSESLTEIGRCRALRALDLSQTTFWNADGWAAVAEGCAELAELNLFAATVPDEALMALAGGPAAGSLTALNLLDAQISSLGIAGLIRACPQLESLVLAGTDVEDTVLESVAALRPPLVELDLRWCEEISDGALCRVVRACPQLATLRLNNCVRITNEALAAIADLDGLVQLEVERCAGVTGAGVTEVALRCHMLAKLNVAWVDGIGVELMRALSECPALAWVDVSGCKGLDDEAAEILCDGSAGFTLQYLNLSWVNAVSDSLYRKIARVHPGVALINYYRERV